MTGLGLLGLAGAIIGNTATVISAITAVLAVIVGPIAGYITYRQSKPHTEEVEESAAISEAIGAVTDANVSITKIVVDLIAPMQAELARMALELTRAREAGDQQSERIDLMSSEMAALQARFTSMVKYVGQLRRQVTELGVKPVPVPDDLYKHGFTFETDGG